MKEYNFAAITVIICLLLQGCSVGMAMSGKEQKDTSILFPGAPRQVVIAKLGPPETSTKDKEGNYIDSYFIVKGNAPSTGRAVAHGALDVATLGLWEVVGTPMEMGAGSEDASRIIIYYDDEEKIRDLQKIGVSKKNEVTGEH